MIRPLVLAALALLAAGCDRLPNRLGRDAPRGCELGLASACIQASQRAPDAVGKLAFLTRACALGSVAACVDEGAARYEAAPPARDRRRAGELFARGCAASVPLGCRNLAVYQDNELHDRAAAIASLRRACALGEPEGCWGLGVFLPAAAPEALRSFERSCALGSVVGCGRLAVHRVENGPPTAQPGAVAALRRACEREDGPSCYVLGVLERDGVGGPDGPRDPEAAPRHFAVSCGKGNGYGCQNLGAMRFTAARTEAERVAALADFERGCELGAMRACAQVGVERLQGTQVPRDVAAGERWLRRSCEGDGYPAGCNDLGVFMVRGVVAGGPEGAAAMFRRACAGGYTAACNAAPTTAEGGTHRRRRRHGRR